MPRVARRGIRFLLEIYRDERGGEVVEFALVAGLMFVSAIATIGCVSTKIADRWNSINSSQ